LADKRQARRPARGKRVGWASVPAAQALLLRATLCDREAFMASAAFEKRFSPKEYLALERKSDTLQLASIGCDVSLREIYAKVALGSEMAVGS
jgi:hypothetical protein